MKGAGPEDDIVIGSRIRLARNISKIPFPAAANDQQAAHVNELVRSVVDSTKDLNLNYLSLIDMPKLERDLLVEKHLISPQQARDVKHKAVVLSGDELVSIMVNEEDHLRIQSIYPGFQLQSAWEQCDQADDVFGEKLNTPFYGPGYLTACPTNVERG